MQTGCNLVASDSERAFLGAVVASNGSVLDQCAATCEHFSDPTTVLLFRTIQGLHDDKAPISLLTVRERLNGTPLPSGEMLESVLQYAPPSAGSYLFDILNDKVSLRRARELLTWAESELPTVTATGAPAFCSELAQRASRLSAEGDAENILPAILGAIVAKLDRLREGLPKDGLTTPITPWNTAFGGLLPGQLYGLGGRPGTGKTAMMEMMIEDCLSRNIPVSVFEKDMAPQKLIERLACRTAGVPFWRLSRGHLHSGDIEKLQTELKLWKKLPLQLYNPAGLSAERFCAIARRDIRVHGVKAVFLDHIQALRVGRDLREGLTQASLTIRATVTETDIPFVVLAHINREGAEGRPRPEHIKEFDQLYGDADGMVLLWSQRGKNEELPPVRTVKFYVAKNRDGAATENDLLFDGPNLTFKTLANEHDSRRVNGES